MPEGRLLDMAAAFIVGGIVSPWLLIWLGELWHRRAVQRANHEIDLERRGKRVPHVS
jgi:hypothetical protein